MMPAHSADQIEASSLGGASTTLPIISTLPRTANTGVVIGVLSLVIAATFSTTGGVFSPELESSVINDDSPFYRVFFENQRGQTLWVYDVWVVDTGPGRYQGLSGTESLPADTGLLFVYDQEAADRAIVMREMYYPIDVVFIDDLGTVTTVRSARPQGRGHSDCRLPVSV